MAKLNGVQIEGRRPELYKNRDYMLDAYDVRRLSAREISEEVGLAGKSVFYWLHKFNIPVRSDGIGKNVIEISPYLKAVIDGELLGDGSMTKCADHSAYFQHGAKPLEYVEWVAGILAEEGVKQGGKIEGRLRHGLKPINGRFIKDTFTYYYRSLSYVAFKEFRNRFYPNDKKIVPRDLVLNPTSVLHWYVGDGSLNRLKNKNWNPYIALWTCAFSREGVEFLRDQLTGFGFKNTYMARPRDNSIRISSKSTKDFLEWIGPCPVKYYNYKWI